MDRTFLDLVTKLMSSGAITVLTKVNFDRQTLTVTWRLGNVLQKLGLKLRRNFPNLVFQVQYLFLEILFYFSLTYLSQDFLITQLNNSAFMSLTYFSSLFFQAKQLCNHLFFLFVLSM